MQGEIWRRSPDLVGLLWAEVFDAGEAVRMPDLVAALVGSSHNVGSAGRPRWSAKTVDNVIGDMCAFGALRKVRAGRDYLVDLTLLGAAWFEGLEQLPRNPADLRARFDEVLDVIAESGRVVPDGGYGEEVGS